MFVDDTDILGGGLIEEEVRGNIQVTDNTREGVLRVTRESLKPQMRLVDGNS